MLRVFPAFVRALFLIIVVALFVSMVPVHMCTLLACCIRTLPVELYKCTYCLFSCCSTLYDRTVVLLHEQYLVYGAARSTREYEVLRISYREVHGLQKGNLLTRAQRFRQCFYVMQAMFNVDVMRDIFCFVRSRGCTYTILVDAG